MKFKTRHSFFAALCLACFIFACQTKKIKTTQTKPEEKTAFYDLKFKHDSVHKKTIITINSIKVIDNRINYVMNEEASQKISNVYIEVKDKAGNIIKAYAEHPLYRKFDLYSESGEIEAKLVSLPEADMTIRIPYYSPYEKIKIVETINKTQTLTTILKNEK